MPEAADYAIRLSWSERDAECVATCAELPWLSGLGPTPAHATTELRIAIGAWLEYLAAHGLPAASPNGA